MQSNLQISDRWQDLILTSTGATSVERGELIETLWSGYGEILKLRLQGSVFDSAILKYIAPPSESQHPRGWNTNLSHQRKLRSYEIETYWYRQWSKRCGEQCRVPLCFATASEVDEDMILMEDLDAAGYPVRHSGLDEKGVELCLRWLAHFHATFMGETPEGLWPVGTYWHLETRPDELKAMDDLVLQKAAPKIDALLSNAKFKTFVHGDAKVANFCFSKDGMKVAAVDFQYVGGGCGMKDVAYFLGSCLDEAQCERGEQHYLDVYFRALKSSMNSQGKQANWAELETEWRDLFPVAWTDFHRFLLGWMPGHWKINRYSHRLAKEVLQVLQIL